MTPPPPLRLLVVDDSEVVRIGLRALLSTEPDFVLVAEAASASEAIALARQHRPDVVLLDYRLPDANGLHACREIIRATDSRVLFLTSVIDDNVIADALRSGAHGYLLKEINGRELIQAIREVGAGRNAIDPAVTNRLVDFVRHQQTSAFETRALTATERKLLALLARGLTNKEIGVDLGLAEKTIKNHLTILFEKLGINRRSQAAAFYVQHLGAQDPPR